MSNDGIYGKDFYEFTSKVPIYEKSKSPPGGKRYQSSVMK